MQGGFVDNLTASGHDPRTSPTTGSATAARDSPTTTPGGGEQPTSADSASADTKTTGRTAPRATR